MLIFVVARSRLDRYEELRRHLGDWRDVRVVLDRREGERRTPDGAFAGADRRRAERRRRFDAGYRKLGWSVVEATSRLVVVLAFALLAVAACASPSKPTGGAEPAQVGRRENEVIVVVSDRTLYFENVRPPCAHWSLPGRWTFAQQPAALRRSDGKGFVGVSLYPEQQFNDFPGSDLITRAVESFRRQTEQDHGAPLNTATEPFSAARAGAVVWRVASTVALPPEVTKVRPELAGQRVRLPSRVLVPFPSGWLTAITVSQNDLDVAREVIATLRTVDRPPCWLPMLRGQFPDVRW